VNNMNVNQGLWQQQTIKLTMTQELSQAIALLQYSSQEIAAFLEEKALENPLLQIESLKEQSMDPRYDKAKKTRKRSQVDKQNWLEQIAKKETSIVDHLYAQIDFCFYDKRIKRIVEFLINSLDENGYLHIDIDEVTTILAVMHQEVEQAIHIIQGLEPAGIGARHLQECLLLQIKRIDEKNELADIIISEYFISFAEKKWKPISQQLGVSMKEIQAVFDYVQSLNPRPASDFYSEQATYITPDIIIKREGECFNVSVLDELLPKIQYNENYYRKFHSMGDQTVNRYLQEKQQDFQWIMRSIEQRKETIIKVALKIIEKQPDFFIYGPEYLKPMTMKEVSDELDIHESTVSRAVREKYAQTPYGTIELRSFFSSHIRTTSNEDISSKQVKTAISELVEKENKLKPLSDQEIVNVLKEEDGIMVSRRTIAKYREQLGIASSSKRKRFE
jgi:RNA polymerase sigma-54 factor